MYVKHNIASRSQNNCCREKEISITYFVCVPTWVHGCVRVLARE